MRRPSRSPTRAAALGGIIGPAAFVAGWAVLGARTPGYSPVGDAISRLAAAGAPTQPAMTAAFVAFGTGLPAYAVALRRWLPGPAWVLAVATGSATLGVAATPLGTPAGDALHSAFAAAGYATLAGLPVAAAATMRSEGRREWARLSAAAGTVSALCLAATAAAPAPGLFQRIGLTVADVWVVATAVAMLRTPSASSRWSQAPDRLMVRACRR